MSSPTTAKMSLATRMKSYEATYDLVLPTTAPIVLRLDGHNFSRFTAHFARPFDQRIHQAMTSTCMDLLSYFPSATVAYTQSDEITLVFPTGIKAFNERVQKLGSLAAGYCSVRFGWHLARYLRASPEPLVEEQGYEALGFAHFDARLFGVPSVAEALNCLLWRCRGDAMGNAVSAFARTLFSHDEMHKMTSADLKVMMQVKLGASWEDKVPRWAVEGCLVKREQFEHEGVNPKTGEREVTWRTRTRMEERGVREFNEEGMRLIEEKYW
ncbi:Thg1-domain-containing protein [Pleomassaria siparia CBS 279.74]|uniref:tRNA(His) guanylyltransferase n=1 Tax=Pleomassaria siparia CBS 279.74 TaxID=1314801 RepID=A0A6G1K204_9PLEO|nr:Thg1-domain-containing protein [Pleomassaria siparia CBS 279.74]